MRSDNNSGVSPEILQAIINENNGDVEAYGHDDLTAKVQHKLKQVFENDSLAAHNLISGTATNSLIIATLSPTYGAIFCHKDSHINSAECGAIEFQSGGAKLITLNGNEGKILPDELENSINAFRVGEPHHIQPSMLSIAQTTELGTVYSLEEIRALSKIARKYNLKFHMDGARFANALAEIGCSPAEMTWKSGVDALSFGMTKNGALSAEAAVFFNKSDDCGFIYRRMRSGHLVSKMRFVSAQILAYLENSLWLKNADHANAMARRLYKGVVNSGNIEFVVPVQSNVMFAKIEKGLKDKLWAEGFRFYDETADGQQYTRLVTAFNTSEKTIDDFIDVVAKYS